MGSLQRDVMIREAAKAAARARKSAAAVSRTGQVARSSISVRDDEVMLDELMAGAVDTAEVTVEHSGDLGLLDDAAVTDFDAILDAGGAADVDDMIDAADAIPDLGEEFDAEAELAEQNHVAHMLAIENAQSVDTAKAEAAEALDKAASAQTSADGKNSRRRGVTEPDPPEGGWVQGDQWIRDVEQPDGSFKPVEALVWNGTEFVQEQIIVNELFVLGENGLVRIADGMVTAEALAADAVDAKTIRGAQIYGGYIEAPVIASSAALGSGANVLDDPQFASSVDTAWVASGHLGDAAVSQVDNITWNQTWTMPNILGVTQTYRNTGSVAATLRLTPAARRPGSIVMANYSWLNVAARTFTNPYTFVNFAKNSTFHGQYGGVADPSFAQVTARAAGTGTARTTYLTNAAVIDAAAGQLWNIRLGFAKLGSDSAKFITGAAVEIIDAASDVVVFTHTITKSELAAGQINAWWTPTTAQQVKYRVRATYTAGGGGSASQYGSMSRLVSAGSYARQTRDGAAYQEWLGTSADKTLRYGAGPWTAAWPSGAQDYTARAMFAWTMEYALFARVEPRKGWRLTEDGGLELFNELGQKTAVLDGQDNYFSGRIGTSESGERFELASDGLSIYNTMGVNTGTLGRDGTGFKFTAYVAFKGDTGWVGLPIASTHEVHSGATPRMRVRQGKLYLKGAIKPKTGQFTPGHVMVIPAGGIPDLPGARHSFNSVRLLPSSATASPGRSYIGEDGSFNISCISGAANYYNINSEYLLDI